MTEPHQMFLDYQAMATLTDQLHLDAARLGLAPRSRPEFHAIADRIEQAAALLDGEAKRLHVMAVNVADRIAENAAAARRRQPAAATEEDPR